MRDQRHAIVYVSCSKGNSIEVLSLDRETGAIARIETVRLGGDGMPLAVSPDGRFLHAAVFARDGDIAQPRYESFAVDQANGKLDRIGTVNAPGRMSFIGVDRSGRHLLGASVANDLITSHAIQPDGSVCEAPSQLTTVPSKAHQITTDPSNRFAFVPNLGAGFVQQYHFDAARGQFSPNEPATFLLHGNVGPRHMAYHPNGRFAYVLCEFDGALVTCALDAGTGILEAIQKSDILPNGFSGEPWGAQIHISGDGRFLFTSDRASNTIGVHWVDHGTGLLTKAGSIETEACPRGFDVDREGKWLVAAGEQSGHVASYAIAPSSGKLSTCDRILVEDGPIWVEIPKH